jgi:hypothetical protein
MRKALTILAFAVIVLVLSVAFRPVTANDPPGGNPALSWDEDATQTPQGKGTACGGSGSSNGCVENKCYTYDHYFGNNRYDSFERTDTFPYGFCTTGDPNQECTKIGALKCVTVILYQTTNCTVGSGTTLTKPVYVKGACNPQGVPNPPVEQ